MAAPPDLSTCQECGRPVPPTTDPDFGNWAVAKDERGKVSGMLCPACKAKAATESQTA